MTESNTIMCAYCERAGQATEPCCGRPEHAHRLVCQDSRDCMGVVLGQLHAGVQACLHYPSAEVIAGRAVLADFQREAAECNGGRSRPADWEAWALRLGQHLQALLDATGRTS